MLRIKQSENFAVMGVDRRKEKVRAYQEQGMEKYWEEGR